MKFKVGDKVRVKLSQDLGKNAFFKANGFPVGYEFIVHKVNGNSGVIQPIIGEANTTIIFNKDELELVTDKVRPNNTEVITDLLKDLNLKILELTDIENRLRFYVKEILENDR